MSCDICVTVTYHLNGNVPFDLLEFGLSLSLSLLCLTHIQTNPLFRDRLATWVFPRTSGVSSTMFPFETIRTFGKVLSSEKNLNDHGQSLNSTKQSDRRKKNIIYIRKGWSRVINFERIHFGNFKGPNILQYLTYPKAAPKLKLCSVPYNLVFK